MARLSITFQHKAPLTLAVFSDAISRIEGRHGRFVRGDDDAPQELLIAQIREGSTILELADWLPAVQATIAAVGGIHTVVDFGKDIADLLSGFRKSSIPTDGLTLADCDDARAIVKPAITTTDGGLTLQIVGDGNIVQPILINIYHQDAREIDNRAALARLTLQQRAEAMFKDVLLVWNQVRDAPGAQEGRPTPDRGIIAELKLAPYQFASLVLKQKKP